MAEYTLSEACVLLGIARRTLDYWLQETNIIARNLPTDSRKKVLTMAQITKLATAHGKRVKEVEGLAALVVEMAALREQVEALEALKRQVEALEARVMTLEARPSIRPSLTMQTTPAPLQAHTGAFSATDDADEQPTLRLPTIQRSLQARPATAGSARPTLQDAGAVSKADATRLVADRHGVAFNTAKGWPWPTEALVSADAALRWSFAYVANIVPHKRPAGWRWKCDTPGCPCHQMAAR